MPASQASRVRLHGLKVRRTGDFEPYTFVRLRYKSDPAICLLRSDPP
jgi:hypothetical protein